MSTNSCTSPVANAVTAVTAAAKMRRMVIKSLNCARKRRSGPRLFLRRNSFFPYFFSLAAASSSDSPLSSVASAAKTSFSESEQYSFIATSAYMMIHILFAQPHIYEVFSFKEFFYIFRQIRLTKSYKKWYIYKVDDAFRHCGAQHASGV